MKRLLHLLWILPLLLLLAVGGLALSESSERSAHEAFYDDLPRALEVRSDDFADGGEIPVEHTCEGAGVSPHLAWSGAPDGTRSYAVVETDWDVPAPWLRLFHVPHWVLYDIPPERTEIAAGTPDRELWESGVTVGLAMGDTEGYLPSCPPLGQHTYEFRVYALDVPELDPDTPDRDGVLDAMEGHVLGYGVLRGVRGP